MLDDIDQRGQAHFTEHMALNGSTYFKKHELISYFQLLDVKFNALLNVYICFDETDYILPIRIEKNLYFVTISGIFLYE